MPAALLWLSKILISISIRIRMSLLSPSSLDFRFPVPFLSVCLLYNKDEALFVARDFC